jgi:hypothetical protein
MFSCKVAARSLVLRLSVSLVLTSVRSADGDGKVIMNNEWISMWKFAIMAYLKVRF